MPVTVVTDSTSYLPAGAAERAGVRIVPLHVLVGSASHLDGVTLGADELVSAMTSRVRVSTSRANPVEIAAVYRQALRDGATHVVGVHLSRKLSGTWEAARLAAEELGGQRVVRVVDSRSVGMGLGFAVLAAAAAAAAGASAVEVEAVAAETAARTRTFFSVDTLEHLRRGGRISAPAAMLGAALAVKPLLHVVDGEIKPLEKVRTSSRAVLRLADLAADVALPGSRAAVHHLAAADRAARLVSLLRGLEAFDDVVSCDLGAVLGAHTGPGALGVVVSPAV